MMADREVRDGGGGNRFSKLNVKISFDNDRDIYGPMRSSCWWQNNDVIIVVIFYVVGGVSIVIIVFWLLLFLNIFILFFVLKMLVFQRRCN